MNRRLRAVPGPITNVDVYEHHVHHAPRNQGVSEDAGVEMAERDIPAFELQWTDMERS